MEPSFEGVNIVKVMESILNLLIRKEVITKEEAEKIAEDSKVIQK